MPNINNPDIKLKVTGKCPIKTSSKNIECLVFIKNYNDLLNKID